MDFSEFKEEFIIETSEEIERLEEILLRLNENPSEESLQEIYRIFHTIKGSSGFLQLNNISECAHSGENLLDFVLKNKISIDNNLINLLFKFSDFFKNVITALQNEEDVEKIKPEFLIREVDDLMNNLRNNDASASDRGIVVFVHCKVADDFSMKGMKAYLIYNKLIKKYKITKTVPNVNSFNLDNFSGEFEFYVFVENSSEIDNIKKILKSVSAVEIIEIKVIPPPQEKKNRQKNTNIKTNSDKISIGKSLDLQFIKIPIERLDTILNLVGELVITNAGFVSVGDDIRDKYKLKSLYSNVRDRIQELERISHELQENVMKIRMLPLSNLFFRYKRFIHDYSQTTGKKINLVIKGEETELDKKIMDIISEPLTHLIRNAVDHGIESESERVKLGKPSEGTLEISAFQESNYIIISIKDDGAGIDLEKIKKTAIKKGIITEEKLKEMSEQQILNIIFEPGFSTSEKVSKISGRGIGMDIVKKTLTDIQGILEIHTKKGKGTEFLIKIPITLAIINAILVMVSNEVYSIPMSSVVETLKIDADDIISVDWQEAIKLRNTILPLLRLETVLKNNESSNENFVSEDEKIPVVVVNYMDKNVGLVVDKLFGKQEIVIKSLSANYRNVHGIAGASILGDGSISLIIDSKAMIDIVKEKINKLPPEKRIKLPNLKAAVSNKKIDINSIINKLNKLKNNINGTDLDVLIKDLPALNISSQYKTKLSNIISESNLNAVKVFNTMVDKDISISSPAIKIVQYKIFKKLLNNLSNHFVFVATGITEGLKGSFVFTLTKDNALKLSNILLNFSDVNIFSEEHKSALKEVTNIIASAYTNALTVMTKYKVSPTVPEFYENKIFAIPSFSDLNENSNIIIVENTFKWDNDEIMGFIFLNLTPKVLVEIKDDSGE